jgi:hypothetical protein
MSYWSQSYDEQNYKQTQIFWLPDDIDIIDGSQAAVREAFVALEKEANKVGLKINESKTKYMIAAENDRTIRDVGQKWLLATKLLKSSKNLCIRNPW